MTADGPLPGHEDDPVFFASPFVSGRGGDVRSRAPLRLGLAGGGTDISSYYETYGGCVLNATIDRYAYATISKRADSRVRFRATDLQMDVATDVSDSMDPGSGLDLHKAVYREMMDSYNGGRRIAVDLTTFCDAPIGSGLGTSSTLVVAMIRGFVEFLGLPLDDYMIANLAFKIERIDCGLQGGKQDQFSAAFGGFNFMEFHAGGHTTVSPLRIKNWIICELEASLILFHTGTSRESSRIIASQSRKLSSGDADVLEAMHAVKYGASVMKEHLIRGDFAGIVSSFRDGWESKKRSAEMISNPRIEEVYETAVRAGALAGKVSGAGGGGFMVFFVPPGRRMEVVRSLSSCDGTVSNCHFTMHGCQAWTIQEASAVSGALHGRRDLRSPAAQSGNSRMRGTTATAHDTEEHRHA